MVIKFLAGAWLVLLATGAMAQQADTLEKRMSPLKSMSYQRYKAYMDGTDLDSLAAVAEVNHFVSPQKALALKKELGLTAAQTATITAVSTELQRKTREMGAMIVKNETTLNTLFKTHKLDDGTLIFYVNRYGLYQGELRNAILQAYIKVTAVLSPAQNKKYRQIQ